jgi:hypothetical protein
MKPTPAEIVDYLRRVVEPGMVVELRILGCVDNPKYPPFTVSGYFDHDHLHELATAACEWTAKAEGCYVTINPVVPDLLARAANRVAVRPKHTTTDDEITRRVGLVFDADPKRPAGVSANASEKAEAQERILKLVNELTWRGWPAPILADSGNGYHARFNIDLANNDDARELIERVLKAASSMFSDDKVTIDTSLSNASRIIKLYGTLARKGDDTYARPHRLSKVISKPDDFQAVSAELLESFANEYQPAAPQPEVTHHRPRGSAFQTNANSGASPEARARAYVFSSGFPDSIAGEHGHDSLYRCACELVDGFGLDRNQALLILRDWNQARAKPPESEKQVQHKLDDAIKNHPVPSLKRLNTDRSGKGENRDEPSALWPPLRFQEPPPLLSFPVEVFPPPLQAYCREVAEAKLAPLDFVGAAMLVVAGAAIGQSVNIKVKRDWTEAPLLFVIIVAPPGKTKSPVVRAVAKPLTEIDRRLRVESAKASQEWIDRKKAHDKDDSAPPPGPEPRQRRAIVKDVTRESLVVILADNPSGVLCDPDEASGWVASFNEYKGKGGSDREFWLSIWGSAPVSVDRKGGRESTYVPFPFAAVVGGLPPVKLDKLTDERSRSDGLLDRIIFTCPEEFPRQYWTEADLSEKAERDWSESIAKLFDAPMYVKDDRELPYLADFTPEARRAWVEWFNAHAEEMDGLEFSSGQSGAWSKMRAHAARFALILSRLHWACNPPPDVATAKSPWETNIGGERRIPHSISVADVAGAIKLVAYFKSHLLRIAHQMTGGIGSAAAKEIVDWIKRKKLSTFREADVGVDLRRFRDQPKALEPALKVLVSAGVIRRAQENREPSKRGPKPTAAYDVHPELLQAPEITSNSDNCPTEPPPEGNSGINGNSWHPQDIQQAPGREVFEL